MAKSWSEQIHLDKEAAEPIYQQLTDQLRELVKASADGLRLPAERTLAEELGVARNTVKAAFNQLVAEKLIVRRGYQGSFVSRDGISVAMARKYGENFSIRSYLERCRKNRKPLRLMVFEPYPTQAVFWRRTVELYNARPGNQAVELIMAPDGFGKSTDELQRYLVDRHIDLVQISRYQDNVRLAAALRPELIEEIGDDERYLTGVFAPQPPPLQGRLVPLYANFYACYYNRTLFDGCGVDLERLWDMPHLFRLLREVRSRVRGSTYLTGSIVSVILAQGFAGQSFEALLPVWRELRRTAGEKVYRPVYPVGMAEQIEAAMRHEQSMIIDWSLLALQKFPDLGFEVGTFPLRPLPGQVALGGGSYLSVSKFTSRYDEAHAFLYYLLEPETQKRLAAEVNVVPFRRQAADMLAELYPGYDQSWWREEFSQLSACRFHDWSEFLSIECADIFREVQSGRIDEEAALQRCRLLWPAFEERKRSELKLPEDEISLRRQEMIS